MISAHITTVSHEQRPLRAALGMFRRIGIPTLALLAIVGGSVMVAGMAGNTQSAAAADRACAAGVAVVVDFTDLGGTVEEGCAALDPESGSAALLAAGFTTTDSQPGLICAINSMPNPCPETFQGSFWSYWHSTSDGDWQSYQVGAGSSDPAPGDIEGWRYNDGTAPPGIAPADVASALLESTPSAIPAQNSIAQDRAAQNTVLTVTALVFLALIITAIIFFIVRARRRGPGTRD